MDKIAAYEMLLEGHPLWEKEANLLGNVTRGVGSRLKNLVPGLRRPPVTAGKSMMSQVDDLPLSSSQKDYMRGLVTKAQAARY